MKKILLFTLIFCSRLTLSAVSGFGVSEPICFDTVDPILQLLSPQAGAFIRMGTNQDIQWDASDDNLSADGIALHFSENGGLYFAMLQDDLQNSGLYNWSVPNEIIETAVLRITAQDDFGNLTTDQNSAPFIIGPLIPQSPQNPMLVPLNERDLLISWDPVISGTYDQALQPEGYLVFYSETSPLDDEGFYLLDYVQNETSCIHLKAFEHWDKMFYRIYAYLSLSSRQERLLQEFNMDRPIRYLDFLDGARQ
jgi:hypothetical protein